MPTPAPPLPTPIAPTLTAPAPVVVRTTAPATSAPAAATPAVAAQRMIPQTLLIDLQARWSEVAQAAMRDGQPLIGGALSGSKPVSFASGTLTIESPADFCDRADADPLVLLILSNLVSQISGHQLTIRVRPPAGLGGGRSARYQAAEAHPLVQALRKRFAADIITREPITRDEWLKRSHGGHPGIGSQAADDTVPGV